MDAANALSGSPRFFGSATLAPPRGGAFSSSLSAAIGGHENRAERDPREAAEELVAITLVQPILAQLRESDMGAEPFAPSDGEKRFGALYDAEIARRMVQGRSFPLVDALARQMRERSQSAEALSSRGTEAATHDAARHAAHEPIDRTA